MATVNKDFRVKHGLIVEGTNATVDGSDIITEDAITGGTQTNITVTYNPTTKVVDFVAENGVADSTTDDLDEGTTNKYFTDTRAVDAVETAATSTNTANKIVQRDANGDFAAGQITSGSVNVQAVNVGAVGSISNEGGFVISTSPNNSLTLFGEEDVILQSANSNIVLNPDGDAYLGSATAGNEIATAGDIETHSDLTTGVHGVTGDVVGTSDAQTLTNKTMGDDLLMDGFQISGLAAPTQADHAATKSYVDAVSEGLHIHESVMVAVNGNIAIATALENGDTAGGVTLATGNRVLLKDQTNTAENGIYVVQASGQALRAADFDTATEVDSGDFVFVTAGTYANTGWVQTNKPATIGTDPILFTQFSGAGTFLAGNGLLLDGNIFEIDDTITATKTYVQDNFVALDDLPGQLDDYIPLTQKAAIDGVATLDGDAQVPTNQLGNQYISSVDANNFAVTSGELSVADGNLFLRSVSLTNPNLDQIAKVSAGKASISATQTVQIFAESGAGFNGYDVVVKAKSTSTSDLEITKLMVLVDSSNNIYVTEYANIQTGSDLFNLSFSSEDWYGGTNRLKMSMESIAVGLNVTFTMTAL